MKEKRSIKTIIAIIKLTAFLLILTISVLFLNNTLKRKYIYHRTEEFFQQEENFDVLFLGSSHIINAVFPMQLWNDYGIISYNLGNYAERLPMTYYNMLLALKETKPKLIVLDAFLLYDKDKITDNDVYFHNTLDAYPISYTKYLAIKDLFNGEDLLNKEAEYLFPFSMYHARWNELEKNDFVLDSKYEKGAESRIGIRSIEELTNYDSIEPYNEEENVNMEYLRKIIEYCQNNNIQILITYLPAPENCIQYAKYTQTICDEYNINYINFLEKNMLNCNIDFYDTNPHINPSGARKITDYLGNYIMENYNIPDQRENPDYSFWYEDYDEYIDMKIKNLKTHEKNLNNYLMLLYGEEDIDYEIVLSSKREIEEGSTLQQLLVNIDNNYKTDDSIFEEKNDKTIKITTYDKINKELIEEVWF